MARSLLLLLVAAVLSGCAASVHQHDTQTSARVHIAHPGPYDTALFFGFDRRIQDSANLQASTIYAVRHCQSPDQCELGVVKPQVSIEFLKATQESVQLKAVVTYDIGPSQTLTFPNIETTVTVPDGMTVSRQEFTKSFSLKFGEQRRLQLPFQDSVIFCAQRVQGPMRTPLDQCPEPKTIEEVTAIQAL